MSAYRVSASVSDADLERAARGEIRIERAPEGLVLRWRWVSLLVVPWFFGFLLFCFFLWEQWRPAASLAKNVVTFPFICCSLAALGFGYLTFAYLLNRTRLVVGTERIVVKHGPVPWQGASVALASLAQLYVKREVYGSSRRTRTVEIRVVARDQSGKDVVLVNGPMHPARARAIERTLETYLSIDDVVVKGEL